MDLDEDISARVIVVAVLTVVIASMFVGARFYTRIRIISMLGKEDWTILISLMFSTATAICMILQCKYALGRHIITIPPSDITVFTQVGWLSLPFYTVSLFLTKVAILLLYIRVLTYEWARIVSKIMLAVVVIFHIFVIGTTLTACVPIQRFWDPTVEGYCHPQEFYWASTYGNILSDFLIFLIPLPIIFTMTLPIRQKIGLCMVFLVGFFVCIVSIFRMILLMRIHISWDPSFDNVIIAMWTCIELNTAIVCACLTTLKPFATRFFPKIFLPRRNRDGRDPEGDPLGQQRAPPTVGSKPIRGVNGARISGFSEFETLSSMISTATTADEKEDVMMRDIKEAETSKAIPELPPLAYFRSIDALSMLSTDRLSNIGPEIKPAYSLDRR